MVNKTRPAVSPSIRKSADPASQFVPVCYAGMPESVLDDLALFMRVPAADGSDKFTLYAEAGVKFEIDRRQKLDPLLNKSIFIRESDRYQLRRLLETKIENVAADNSIQLAARCEIIYESSLELIGEIYSTQNMQKAMPRAQKMARSIVSLYQENPQVFNHFFSGAHHDGYAATHAMNVAVWLPALAIASGENRRDQLTSLSVAALFYDIGMAFIPPAIINKDGKLNPHERQQIRQHPEIGAQMLRQVPDIDPLIVALALQHHERLDGTGYPRALNFDQISHASRMIAVVDAFDALTSVRPYRSEAASPSQAAEALKRETPHLYDPRIVGTWTALLQDACPEMLVQQPNGNMPLPDGGADERRRFQRYGFNTKADMRPLTLRGGMWTEENTTPVIVKNLSRGGLGLLTRIPLNAGQYFRVKISGKGAASRRIDVVVARSRDCGDGWFEAGMRFIDLTAELARQPDGEFVIPNSR